MTKRVRGRNLQPEWVPQAVVIGASAGGFEALGQLISGLPAHFSLPVVTVLHVGEGMSAKWEQSVAKSSQLPVVEAADKQAVVGGRVYLAPPGYHLLIERDKIFSLSVDARVNLARPSIDVLFESAADAYGPNLVGVILTGASGDGALGLRAVAAAGGRALVQDPSTAKFRAMPEAALEATATASALPLAAITRYLAGLALHKDKADPS